jgi:hypothetical protein
MDPVEGSSDPRPWKRALLGTLVLGSLAAFCFLRPIPQPPGYHRFADQRPFLGVPHFLDVASNLPFLVAGLFGLYNALTKQGSRLVDPAAQAPWAILMASIFLTGLGSCYYHWAPGDATLFWDRLPMALGFSQLLGIMILERVDRTWGRRLWLPILLAGLGSLLYWRRQGDLRWYVLLQAWAVVLVPVILLLFEPKTTHTKDLGIALALYALSKVFELLDVVIFNMGTIVSGHTLKHLAAGLASWFLYRHLARRRALEAALHR